jgi:hypothetical protein
MEDGPQADRLGDAASGILQAWLEGDDVSLRPGATVEAIEDGRVRLADGGFAVDAAAGRHLAVAHWGEALAMGLVRAGRGDGRRSHARRRP